MDRKKTYGPGGPGPGTARWGPPLGRTWRRTKGDTAQGGDGGGPRARGRWPLCALAALPSPGPRWTRRVFRDPDVKWAFRAGNKSCSSWGAREFVGGGFFRRAEDGFSFVSLPRDQVAFPGQRGKNGLKGPARALAPGFPKKPVPVGRAESGPWGPWDTLAVGGAFFGDEPCWAGPGLFLEKKGPSGGPLLFPGPDPPPGPRVVLHGSSIKPWGHLVLQPLVFGELGGPKAAWARQAGRGAVALFAGFRWWTGIEIEAQERRVGCCAVHQTVFGRQDLRGGNTRGRAGLGCVFSWERRGTKKLAPTGWPAKPASFGGGGADERRIVSAEG